MKNGDSVGFFQNQQCFLCSLGSANNTFVTCTHPVMLDVLVQMLQLSLPRGSLKAAAGFGCRGFDLKTLKLRATSVC